MEVECRKYASAAKDILGSENGLSPIPRQAIIWTSAGILSIGPLEANFSEIVIEIETFSLTKMPMKCRLRNRGYFVHGKMS